MVGDAIYEIYIVSYLVSFRTKKRMFCIAWDNYVSAKAASKLNVSDV